MGIFIKIIFMMFVGGVIGWMTNVIAIKLLFRPLKPVKVLCFEFVGLIPKRRNEIAKSIGETVDKELISMGEITDQLLTEDNKAWVLASILKEVDRFVSEKLGILAAFGASDMINDLAKKELPAYIDKFAHEFADKATDQIDIGKMVEEKINEFPLEKVEEIIITIAKKELSSIEKLGGILGCAIGLIQALIIIGFW